MTEQVSPEDNGTESITGVVLRSTGSWYDVQVGERMVRARTRGRLRLVDQDATNPVAVGDYVGLRLLEDESGLITHVHERRNRLSRRAAGRRVGQEHIIAANIDRAWIIQSVRMPKINTGLIDRFLVMAGSMEVPAGLVFNKIDLMQPEDAEAVGFIRDLYAGLGYPVVMTSALSGEHIDTLKAHLAGRVNVVSGPSGVGKSALINCVQAATHAPIGNVSDRTKKGKHTTTFATTYPLGGGGFVIDTPGIREFGIIDLQPEELSYYFVEFRPYLSACRFLNCTHDHEPDCAVKDAVEEDAITVERYDSYLNILESLRLGEGDVGR